MSKRIVVGLIALALASNLIGFGVAYLRPRQKVTLRLCIPRLPTAALPALAQRVGYFTEEGLSVNLETKDHARACMEGLVVGQYDLVVANVAPSVQAAMMANPLVIITELHNSAHETGLVYHNSKELSGQGFAGKRVAIPAGTDGATLLRLYAKEHIDILLSQLKQVKTKTCQDAAELLKQGKVDAAIMHEPQRSQFLRSFPPGEYVSEESVFYTSFSLLVGQAAFADAHPDIMEKTIQAMARAQKYIERNGERARTEALLALGLEDNAAERAFWPNIHFNLGLTSVLLAMMDVAENSFDLARDFAPAETSNLNIYTSLYPQTLRKLDPDLVTYE